jgi:hypothetical protein
VALAETDFRVAYPLQLIRRLYRLEYLADLQQLTHEERAALRSERTRDALDSLLRWLLAIREQEPPSSELAKAVNYCLNHWTALTRFLDDGRLSPDNNVCEEQLRDVALGRKNYLFAGSHDAARRTTALYSLLRTCAQHDVPPLPYLTDLLRKLARGWDENRLEELLPHCGQLLDKDSEHKSESLTAPSLAVFEHNRAATGGEVAGPLGSKVTSFRTIADWKYRSCLPQPGGSARVYCFV